MMRITPILLASLLAASASLPATQGLLAPEVEVPGVGLPDPMDVALNLHNAETWTERYLALAAYFQPTLQAPPLELETRGVVELIDLIYTRFGTTLITDQAQHLDAQLAQLPPGVAYALQQLLGAVLQSILTYHVATATLTPADWQVLAKYGPETSEEEYLANYGEIEPVLAKMDASLLQLGAARMLVVLDHVTPILEEALTHPLLQQQRAVPPFPGPNEGILFNDPFNLVLVGDIGKSVYYGNTWPYPTIGPYEHLLIIDLAGDDEYRNHPARAYPGLCIIGANHCGNSFVSILLDITGNDAYIPRALGGSVGEGLDGGLAILLDAAGNDRYIGTNSGGSSLGMGFSGGIGLLLDTTGSDLYQSTTYTQGAATGIGSIGMLIDANGNDIYHGGWNSQGATLLGQGYFADLQGDDVVNGGYWSQGKVFAGGLGVHMNVGGNDAYSSNQWSRGYTATCWDNITIIPIPDCPNDLDDFAAVFLDICGTDSYTGWIGDNQQIWEQSAFGRGADQRDAGLCTGNE